MCTIRIEDEMSLMSRIKKEDHNNVTDLKYIGTIYYYCWSIRILKGLNLPLWLS